MGKPEIRSLPLTPQHRAQFIKTADVVFDAVLRRLEVENPAAVRALWSAGDYIDNSFLSEAMLPKDIDYAHSLIDAFLVHYVIDLVERAEGHGNATLH